MRPLAVTCVVVFWVAAPTLAQSDPAAALDQLATDVWRHALDNSPDFRLKEGLPIEEFPGVTRTEFEQQAEFSRGVLERLAAIDPEALDHERWLSHRILEWQAERVVEQVDLFHHVFQVTPYFSSFRTMAEVFAQVPLATEDDRARHLGLLRQAADIADDLAAVLETQREMGILLPRPEIPLVENLWTPLTAVPGEHPFRVAPGRLDGVDPGIAAKHLERVKALLADAVAPAYARMLAVFDDGYRSAAPAEVGLGRQPGGAAAYRQLVDLYTTRTGLDPEAIHRRGLELVERIDAEMAELRVLLGAGNLTAREFHQRLRTDPRFLACDPEGVGERLMAPVRRLEPVVSDWFGTQPEAPYGVARLDPALEPAMTFGYYQWPTPAEPVGRYFYNGSSLDERPLVTAAALIAHELVPGHHFQIALQTENDDLPEFRRNAFPTAFVEGWAEYASAVAGEMGLYAEPYDRYGRLAMEMFLAVRLVVDTGMNALGWTREEALELMRARLLESDTQLATETLRYAVDIPGQALAYMTGALAIRDLRQRAEAALGERFDIRRFHDAVLGHGAMPLDVLDEHVEWWIGEELGDR
jgi:uncharacterized protein (DUF885 family)